MAELPVMPWHWPAYFGDTKHLTCIEHGAYDQILGTMWLAGGTLPLDDRFIARTTKLTSTQWKRMRPIIMGFMQVLAGNQFTQPKLLETMAAVRRHSALQSDRARARWLKKKGLPDVAASIRHSRGNANEIREENTLPGQSTTPNEGKKGLSGTEQVSAPETIVVSEELAARYRVRRA